jgi:hypothetical protein
VTRIESLTNPCPGRQKPEAAVFRDHAHPDPIGEPTEALFRKGWALGVDASKRPQRTSFFIKPTGMRR